MGSFIMVQEEMKITRDYNVTIRIKADSESDVDTIWSNIQNELNDVRAGYSVEIIEMENV